MFVVSFNLYNESMFELLNLILLTYNALKYAAKK
jgi:hypothetical protein